MSRSGDRDVGVAVQPAVEVAVAAADVRLLVVRAAAIRLVGLPVRRAAVPGRFGEQEVVTGGRERGPGRQKKAEQRENRDQKAGTTSLLLLFR